MSIISFFKNVWNAQNLAASNDVLRSNVSVLTSKVISANVWISLLEKSTGLVGKAHEEGIAALTEIEKLAGTPDFSAEKVSEITAKVLARISDPQVYFELQREERKVAASNEGFGGIAPDQAAAAGHETGEDAAAPVTSADAVADRIYTGTLQASGVVRNTVTETVASTVAAI